MTKVQGASPMVIAARLGHYLGAMGQLQRSELLGRMFADARDRASAVPAEPAPAPATDATFCTDTDPAAGSAKDSAQDLNLFRGAQITIRGARRWDASGGRCRTPTSSRRWRCSSLLEAAERSLSQRRQAVTTAARVVPTVARAAPEAIAVRRGRKDPRATLERRVTRGLRAGGGTRSTGSERDGPRLRRCRPERHRHRRQERHRCQPRCGNGHLLPEAQQRHTEQCGRDGR